jgi:hypothetical protein
MKPISFRTKIMVGLIVSIVYILFYCLERNERFQVSYENRKRRSLYTDGFVCMFHPEYIKTENIPCKQLQQDILQTLPKGYTFLDYIYKIDNTSLSSFHRDVTSSQHIYKTKYPVYTAILYKYDGEHLSVCPRSNKTYPFVFSTIVNVSGKAGTVFLFDSDLLHAGMKNGCKKREVIQYKICHKEDVSLLPHLHKIRAHKRDACTINIGDNLIRKSSYYFQLPINTVLYPLMIKRESDESIIGTIQSYLPLQFYNNV